MAAPAWSVLGRVDAGATTLNITAPASGVDLSQQVVLMLTCGVVAAPTAPTVASSTTVQPVTTTTNSWWMLHRVTSLTNGGTVTADMGASGAKFMSGLLVAYPGSGLGAVGAPAAKASSTASLTLPAVTPVGSGSTFAAFWTARDAGAGALTAVTDGTIRATARGTGSNNTIVGVSDKTTSGATTGTFSAASGNGGGTQVEILPVTGTPPPASSGFFIMVDGTEVPLGQPFIMVGGTEVPVTLQL